MYTYMYIYFQIYSKINPYMQLLQL